MSQDFNNFNANVDLLSTTTKSNIRAIDNQDNNQLIGS
jgi:hypothetical protein